MKLNHLQEKREIKLYTILTVHGFILSKRKGRCAGWKIGKIFGTLDCKSGMRMKKENRVFFFSKEDAIKCGYRACKKCKPI